MTARNVRRKFNDRYNGTNTKKRVNNLQTFRNRSKAGNFERFDTLGFANAFLDPELCARKGEA